MLLILFHVTTARADDSTRGWAAFGAETGFVLATGGTALVVDAGLSTGNEPMWVAPVALGLGVGLPVLGALPLASLAAAGDWDREAGWGAAGTWPGALVGMMLASGLSGLSDPLPTPNTRVGVASLGALAGAIVGYLAFEAAAESRPRPGFHLLATWAGLLVGMMGGILARSGPTDASPILLLGPACAATGFALAHLLTW